MPSGDVNGGAFEDSQRPQWRLYSLNPDALPPRQSDGITSASDRDGKPRLRVTTSPSFVSALTTYSISFDPLLRRFGFISRLFGEAQRSQPFAGSGWKIRTGFLSGVEVVATHRNTTQARDSRRGV
jgi:hypothetical protein